MSRKKTKVKHGPHGTEEFSMSVHMTRVLEGMDVALY